MSSEINFLNILEENKGDIEKIKKIITENKSIINKEIKIIKSNSEILINSPLTFCLEKKYSELGIFLIDKGADINYKTFPKEDYPLLIACRNGLEKVVEKLLLRDNININCINKNNENYYTILLHNINIPIHQLIMNYVKKKSNKTEKKIYNNKLKMKSKSLNLILQYKSKNNKFGKFLFLCFNIQIKQKQKMMFIC